MRKFKYRIVSIQFGLGSEKYKEVINSTSLTGRKDQAENEALRRALNELGERGWELVSIRPCRYNPHILEAWLKKEECCGGCSHSS